MSSFTRPLILKYINGKIWKLYEEFDFWFNDNRIKRIIEVPCNFITDLATIPRFLWWFLSPTDLIAKAAVIHDYLYENEIFDRKKCDDIFYEAMLVAGLTKYKAKIAYFFVRIFGVFFYGSNKSHNRKTKKLSAVIND